MDLGRNRSNGDRGLLDSPRLVRFVSEGGNVGDAGRPEIDVRSPESSASTHYSVNSSSVAGRPLIVDTSAPSMSSPSVSTAVEPTWSVSSAGA